MNKTKKGVMVIFNIIGFSYCEARKFFLSLRFFTLVEQKIFSIKEREKKSHQCKIQRVMTTSMFSICLINNFCNLYKFYAVSKT